MKRLIVKRYILPIVLVSVIYSLIYFIFNGNMYFNIGLILSLLFFYLVRVVDDYFDYDKDLENGKVLFSKKSLNMFIYILGLIFISLAIIFGYYYFIVLLILLYISIIFKYTKLLFVPSVILLIIMYEMEFNYIYYIMAVLFIIGDYFLIRKE